MPSDALLHYLKFGLSATPDVVETLLCQASFQTLNARPDPERFTLREVVAHLADWESVWLERVQKLLNETHPELPSYDESQWAIDHNYAQSDLAEQLAKFAAGRKALLAVLNDAPTPAWNRTAAHYKMGSVTLTELAAFILGHDGYHLQQITQFLK